MHLSTDQLPLPCGLSMEHHASGVTITRLWRNMASWALLPLALVVVGGVVALFRAVHGIRRDDPILLIPLFFGIVAIVFSYIVLRRLFNVTRLVITPQRITVSQGPIPRWRSFETSAESIRQIEVRPYLWRYNGSEVTYHHVWVVHHDGLETCLLERDETKEQAHYVQVEVQRVLGLVAKGVN
ncbi:MAG: hypothetical protein ABL974_06030 [Prosthecobacter sp.]